MPEPSLDARDALSWDDLLDLVHDSVIVRRLNGAIITWNSAAEALYGWPANEALGKNAHALLHAQADAPIAALEAELLQADRWEGELRRRSAAGASLIVHARWALRRDAQGQPAAIIETARNLTPRREAEAALHESEHRYGNLFHAMAASFWELDFAPVGAMLRQARADGVRDFPAHFAQDPDFVRAMMRATRVLDVNEQSVALFGAGERAALMESVEPFWPEASNAVFAASVIAAVSGQPAYSSETKLRTRDGREFECFFTACFPPGGVASGKLLIGVIDISERVRAQEMLRTLQAEFAHAARVSMLGELTASIAHEVNQPLAAIAANAAAGLRWLDRPEPDTAEVRALAGRIAADARRAADIVARVRDMAAHRAPQRARVPLNEAIEEAALFLRHEMHAHNVRLTLDLPQDAPAIFADRTQIQQVLANLAINAMQAMGETHAGAREITVRAERADGNAIISVEDTGPGLPAEIAERLFESFFTTKETGMGMGLPICRSIVEAHNGAVRASNREGGGARFIITVPLAPDSAA